MPMEMQAKLLRVLESGEVVRVGSNEPRHVDVRLISATNHDLRELIKQGKFREDLYFRIRGVEVNLPSLRQRREDLPALVRHFIRRFAEQMNRSVHDIDENAMLAVMQYDWPGNVRQLINAVQQMVAVAGGDVITIHDVPFELRSGTGGAEAPTAEDMGSMAGMSLDQIEKQAIRNTLRLTAGNREAAAKLLGIGERTLYRKLKEYGLK
jgi:two-component system response regulator HydG